MYLFDLGLVDYQPIRLVLQPVLCPAQQPNTLKQFQAVCSAAAKAEETVVMTYFTMT